MKVIGIKRDFTFAKYVELCHTLRNSDYTLLTVEKYLTMKNKPDKFVIMRHDVDDGADLPYTLAMARKEVEVGIAATYYFRVIDDVFKPEIIKEVVSLGHEIGYHYDVFGKADGDYGRAIELFEYELNKLRKFYNVKTISMHGGPFVMGLCAASFLDLLRVVKNIVGGNKTFVNWDSRDLWKRYDFQDYGVIGDVYLSINFNEVVYFSDTNISWSDTKHRLKDFVESDSKAIIKSTDDLIATIERGDSHRILILVHPPNWRDGFGDWLKWQLLQLVKNTGKTFLKEYWNFKQKENLLNITVKI